jgi:hypothetical protein
MTDLETAYLAQTRKLAAVTSVLGLMGDHPEAELAAAARRFSRDRHTLLTQARRVVATAQASEVHAGVHYAPSTEIEYLRAVVRDAEAPVS